MEHPEYSIDLTPDELRGLYRDMVLTRRFDAEAITLQRQGELGLWASLLGQEAAQIGSGRATRPDDYVFPTYREHGVAWTRGVDPLNLLGMFRGVNNGGWDPNENNFQLYTIVIGSQTLHAAGYAMGVAKDGADSAVIAYFGDGASSQGDVAEAFTFSAVYNAPVVFFCQNNQWAISEPTEKQSRVPIYQRADGFGFPGVRVDGNDVLAVPRGHPGGPGAGAQRRRPDAGRGVHLPDGRAHHLRRPDAATGWTTSGRSGRPRTPSRGCGPTWTNEGLADEAFYAEVDAESDALAKRVREGVRSMPDPDPMVIFENVYADGHALVDEERAQFAAYHGVLRRTRTGKVALIDDRHDSRQGDQRVAAHGAGVRPQGPRSWARTSASSAASSGSPTACRRTSARSG